MADDPVAVLTAALQDPDLADRHEQIRSALARRMPVGVGAPDPHAPAPPPPPHENTFGERMSSGWDRIKGMAEPPARAAGSFANRVIDKATFGASTAAEDAIARHTGVRVGDTPEQRADFQQDHPWAAGTADALGYMTPVGPKGAPAVIGERIGRGIDALTGVAARRGAAKIAAKTLGGAATGAATAGITRGQEALSRGEDPIHAGSEALDAAASPYSWGIGAGMGAAGGVAGEGARAARESSPDLSILHKYGLEPGPVPGRPVIRESGPITGSSEPPLGVSRATPATRGAAARAAADVIVPDMAERAFSNNQRFGELQKAAYQREGGNLVDAGGVLGMIDQHLNDARTPGATKAALAQLKERTLEHSVPTTYETRAGEVGLLNHARTGERLLVDGQPVRGGIYVRAAEMDGLRSYARQLGDENRAAQASDIPIRRVTDLIRHKLEERAPGISALNRQYEGVQNEFSARREMMGFPRVGERPVRHAVEGEEPPNEADMAGINGEQPFIPSERVGRAVASRFRQADEETAAAGGGTTRGGSGNERLGRMGAPPTLPGTQVPPEPGYSTHLDKPRLQLAQENLQLTPSKVFSGAGQPVTSGAGVAHRLLHAAPTRLLYPLARRAGEAPVGSRPVAADALISALRGRRDKSMTNWQTDEGAH